MGRDGGKGYEGGGGEDESEYRLVRERINERGVTRQASETAACEERGRRWQAGEGCHEGEHHQTTGSVRKVTSDRGGEKNGESTTGLD